MPRVRNNKNGKPQIRCAIYTRKSTDEGLDLEFNTLDAQREAGESYVASMKHEGWTCLADRYDDGGFSGGDMNRPALRQLLADIQDGRIDCVVVYKVDRLSRSLLDFTRMMETFEKHEVSFVSVTQQFNTTHSMGRLTLNILLSFAQFEREIISERVRDKIAAQRRRGKWCGGKPILGYDVDRSTASPRLAVNALEAARVRDIFALYLELGSLLPVVEELERRGWCNKAWTTRRGDPRGGTAFDKSALHALLVNPTYIGKLKHKDQVFDGEHEAIVETEVFERVQRQLRDNGHERGALTRNRHGALLRGLLYCRACGRMMTHTFSSRGPRKYRYYKCTRRNNAGCDACPTPSLPAGEIERMVLDEVRRIGTDRKLQAEVLEQARGQIKQRLAQIDREVRALRRELARCGDDVDVRGNGREPGAKRDTGQPPGDVAGIVARLDALQHERNALAADPLERREVNRLLRDFDGVWDALTRREQIELVHTLVARVEYDSADGKLAISIHPSGIRALAEEPEEVTA